MSTAPAGWYPDPEHPGATRYWDGAAWAAPMPPKKRVASKVLAGFAIGTSLIAPGLMVGTLGLGLATVGIATLFGMQGMEASVLVDGLLRWAATGARWGIPFALIAAALALAATLVKPRARSAAIRTAWVMAGGGLLLVTLVLLVARPFDF